MQITFQSGNIKLLKAALSYAMSRVLLHLGTVAIISWGIMPSTAAADQVGGANQQNPERSGKAAAKLPPRAVVGRVTDFNGQPVDDALVEWGAVGADPTRRESTMTDRDGLYRLETNQYGPNYHVGISKDGYAPFITDLVTPGRPSAPTEINATLAPGATVQLQLVTSTSDPLPDLDVIPETPSNGFFSSFSSPTPSILFPGRNRSVRTDVHGRVTLADLPALPNAESRGNWLHVRVEQNGKPVHDEHITTEMIRAGTSVVLKIAEDQLPSARADSRGIIRGRVASRGKPVAKFSIVQRYSSEVIAVDDPEGKFSVTGLRPNHSYQIRVFTPEHAIEVVSLTAEKPEDAEEHVIALKPHPSFHGRLVDASTNEPLAGMTLVTGAVGDSAHPYIEWSSLGDYADGHHSLKHVLRVKTDTNGDFIVPEFPNMPTSVIALLIGYERMAVMPSRRAPPDAGGVVTIALQRESKLTIVADRQTQFGALADSASIGFDSGDGFEHMNHSMPLDERGQLTFHSLAAGKYSVALYAHHDSVSFPLISKSVELPVASHREVVLGPMPGTSTLHGQTEPFARVTLSSTETVEPQYYTIPADVDGAFAVRGLMPGAYELRVSKENFFSGYHGRLLPNRKILLQDDLRVNLLRNVKEVERVEPAKPNAQD